MIRFEKFNEGLQVLADNSNMTPPPAGLYTCKVTKVFHDLSVPSKEYVGTRFEVVGGEYAGRQFSHRWYLRDERGIGAGRFMGLIKACGLEPSETFNEQDLVDKILDVKLRVKEKDGNSYTEVHWVQPASDDNVPF